MDIYDLIIIGAGPGGLAASIYALERKLATVVLEANVAGGQLATLYPDKAIYDFPSYQSIKASELAEKMISHARTVGANIVVGGAVKTIKKNGTSFSISAGEINYDTKSIILASGMGHYSSRKLGVKGEQEFLHKGVFYQSLQDKLTGKRVVVVGGGDTALEVAIQAAEKGAAVTLVHRRDSFRATEKTQDKLKSLGILIYYLSEVSEIHGSDQVESIEIIKGGSARSFITADYICICIGMEIDRTFLGSIGVDVKNEAVVVDLDMKTSMPGIFACGDVVIPTGKYKRISIAMGTAATAINGVYQYLRNPYWANVSS